MTHKPKLNVKKIESLLRTRPTSELEKQVAQEMETPDRPLTVDDLRHLSAKKVEPLIDMSPVELTEDSRRETEMELIEKMDQELNE